MYIKHLKKDRTRKFPTRICKHLTGVSSFFRNPNFAWKNSLKNKKKQQPWADLQSIHHVSTLEISTTIGPLKVSLSLTSPIYHLLKVSLVAGMVVVGLVRISQWIPGFDFFVKRELEGRQEDFEIQHHLTNELYVLRPSSKHSLRQNEWGVFCLT